MSNMEHYRKVFDQFDLNGDGNVTLNELGVALRSAGVSVGDGEIMKMLESADMDASGGIDFQEFVAFLESIANSRHKNSNNDQGATERAKQIFQFAADINGFDLVGADDLTALTLSEHGVTSDETVAIATVAKALQDRNVDWEEFDCLWQAAQKA